MSTMSRRTKIATLLATAVVLVGGGTAAATVHAGSHAPQVTYRLDNAACNALTYDHASPEQVAHWLRVQYHAGAYESEAITVHAVDRGCGR